MTPNRTHTATLTDGRTIDITVYQLTPRTLPQYLACTDEAERLLLVTRLDADLLDLLDLDTYEALLKADAEVNAPFASRRAERALREQARQLAWMREAMPEIYTQAEAGMIAAMQGAMSHHSSASVPTTSASPTTPGSTPSTPR